MTPAMGKYYKLTMPEQEVASLKSLISQKKDGFQALDCLEVYWVFSSSQSFSYAASAIMTT